MFSSSLIVATFMLLVVFIFYKRDMIKKFFSIDITSPTNQFQAQLEQIADTVIKRLEEQITHLEYLLEEANEKIVNLDNKIQIANEILNKENNNQQESLHTLIRSTVTPNTGLVANETTVMNSGKYKEMGRTNKRSSIIEMADLGYDITEIAKATGISKGEIMLLLQLNKK